MSIGYKGIITLQNKINTLQKQINKCCGDAQGEGEGEGGGEVSPGELIFGCTDPSALNYNPDATVNDGSCEYEVEAHVGEKGKGEGGGIISPSGP